MIINYIRPLINILLWLLINTYYKNIAWTKSSWGENVLPYNRRNHNIFLVSRDTFKHFSFLKNDKRYPAFYLRYKIKNYSHASADALNSDLRFNLPLLIVWHPTLWILWTIVAKWFVLLINTTGSSQKKWRYISA